MIRRLITPILAALLLGGAFYLTAAASEDQAGGPAADGTKRVLVGTVEAAPDVATLTFSGTTRAADAAVLAFILPGRLEARPAEVGDRVARGQVLARLDAEELRHASAAADARLAELEARLAQAEREHDRVTALREARAATEEEVEQTATGLAALRASVDAARAHRDDARRRLDESRLTAPFAGTVTAVHLEPGEHAGAGQPIVALAGSGTVELEVEVPESVILDVRPGDELRVMLPALGRETTGRITSLGQAAPGPGRLFPVVAALAPLPDTPLVPGLTAELVVTLRDDAALTLPVEAVINPGGRQPAVFRVVGDGAAARVERLPVEVGRLLAERVTVSGDLAPGDRVVVGGQRGLLDGESVVVLEAADAGGQR